MRQLLRSAVKDGLEKLSVKGLPSPLFEVHLEAVGFAG